MNKYTKENMLEGVKKSWKKFILKEMEKDYFQVIFDKINNDLQDGKTIFPFPENVFETFKYCKRKDLKCIILGQDPYINHQIIDDNIIPQAMGMSFSVPKSVRTPPSLKNIYKEMNETLQDFNIPEHGDLSRWVKKEKIILLNAALTVVAKKSNSHAKVWKEFTDNLIKYISRKNENVVFILWGNFAKSKAKLIDLEKHKVISGVHPSPLAANYKAKGTHYSFFGHDYFNKTNQYLLKNSKTKINWKV